MRSIRPVPARILILLICGLCLLSSACDENPAGQRIGSNLIGNDLVFSRTAGVFPAMGTQYAICCDVWEEGHIDAETLKIFFYGSTGDVPFWKIFLVIDQVQVGGIYAFPGSGGAGPVQIFLSDGSNEFFSDTDYSSGYLKVVALDCGDPLRVSLDIEAVVGSEAALVPPVIISGTFEAIVYQNPSQLGCNFSM